MRNNIVIIGAGAAGLAAGVHLCSNGHKVIIYERRNLQGGRAYSMRDSVTGEMVDNGQHLLAGAYRYFPQLLKALGTDKYLFAQKALDVPFIENGKTYRLDTGKLPGKAGLALGLMLFGALSVKSKLNIFRLFLRIRAGKVAGRGQTTLGLLVSEKQTTESIEKFWNPIIVSALNQDASKADSGLFITVMNKAFFSGPENSRLIFPTADFNELFEPAADWFAERGSVLLPDRQAKQLIIENGRIKAIRIDREEIEAHCVISAIPPVNLLKILPDEYKGHEFFAPLHKFNFSSIISAYFWFDTEIFSGEFAALLGTRLHWAFNRRRICRFNKSIGGNYPYCLSFTISDAGDLADMSMERLKELLIGEITKVFPKASSAKLLHSKIVIEKNATPGLTPEMEPQRLPANTPIGNLFLAGDWTATGLPATLESAAQSGYAAAEEALKILNF